MDECNVLNLTVETFHEPELGFSSTVILTFIVDILRDLLLENLRGLRFLQNLVLAKRQEFLETILGDGETDDELLPREERSVQEPG